MGVTGSTSKASRLALNTKVFELDAFHRSPKEILQQKIIERAVEKSAIQLRAGSDLEMLRRLSKMTTENAG